VTDPSAPNRDSVNKIFGDSLPETTKDEWDDHSADGDGERDDWLRANVPPHHG
jgi:hypothetical protein